MGTPPSTGLEKCWLPKCNSMRTRPGRIEPEVYFKVIHAALQGHNGGPVAKYREQTVEIALGPKGAFENDNIGTLTRQVATAHLVHAVPPRQGKPRKPRESKPPRVVELLRKAIEWQTLLESDKAVNQADIARQEGITRARVTQVMGMLRLVPEIKQHILSMPDIAGRSPVTERMLRPIGTLTDRLDQIRELHKRLE